MDDAETGAPDGPGRIVLAATPLGNPADASAHLVELLAAADVVAAEDTRRTLQLADALGVRIAGRLLSHHDHNEASRADDLVAAARDGETVLVVSDAGMPTVSDPGFRLVQRAAAAGVPVTCAPGPSAVLTALAVSGLPTDRFTFEGFLPRKESARRRALAELAGESRTAVLFESPRRLAATLATASEILGADRRAAVARELTKTYEEVRRGTLTELADWAADGVRGEIVIVIEGADPARAAAEQLAELTDLVLTLTDGGMRLKAAAKIVGERHGLSVRDLYQGALERRQG